MGLKSTTDKLLKGDIGSVVSDVKTQLERSLNLIGVIIISLAAMIGSGLFVLPSFAAEIMFRKQGCDLLFVIFLCY